MKSLLFTNIITVFVVGDLFFTQSAMSQSAGVPPETVELGQAPVGAGVNTGDKGHALEYPEPPKADVIMIENLTPYDFPTGYMFDSLNQHASFTICDVCSRDPTYSGCNPLPKHCRDQAEAAAAAPYGGQDAIETDGTGP